MALDSMQEILDKSQAWGKPFWEVVLETDMQEREVSREASLERMRHTWRSMVETTITSASFSCSSISSALEKQFSWGMS